MYVSDLATMFLIYPEDVEMNTSPSKHDCRLTSVSLD